MEFLPFRNPSSSDLEDGLRLRCRFEGHQFEIDISESNFIRSPVIMSTFRQYRSVIASDRLRMSGEAMIRNDYGWPVMSGEQRNTIYSEIFTWALEPIRQQLNITVQATETTTRTHSLLSNHFYPGLFKCSLSANLDRLTASPVEHVPAICSSPGAYWRANQVPVYYPDEVEIETEDIVGLSLHDQDLEHPPATVHGLRRNLLFVETPFGAEAEIVTYLYIQSLRFRKPNTVRIPTLHGVVLDGTRATANPNTSPVLGILIDDIDGNGDLFGHHNPHLSVHAEKWVEQVCRSVRWLHEIGVIWGQPSCRDVVMDTNNNVWIRGFSHGEIIDPEIPYYIQAEEMEGLGEILAMLTDGSMAPLDPESVQEIYDENL